MGKTSLDNYTHLVAERFRVIMETIGLEISGIAVFLDKSESHIYSILNGRRELTTDLALDLGNKLGFDGNKIFKLNQPLPEDIQGGKFLNNFKLQYRNNPEYFSSTLVDRKLSYFIKFELLNTDLFNSPKYVWEVNEACKAMDRVFDSDTISKHLKYLVKKGILKSRKERIKLRNGEYGSRTVDVFFK